MKRKYYLMLSCLAVAFVVLSILGCADGKKQEAKQPTPLILGIGYDVSGSAEKNGVPILNMSHLDKSITIIQKRSGNLAFGVMDDKSFEPLDRLPLPIVAGRLDERAQATLKSKDSIAKFRSDVEPKLKERNSKVTDFYGSLNRFMLFFNEPTPHAEKILIVISDGIDTVTKRSNIQIPADLKVFAVGMDKSLAVKIFGDKVVLFESIDSALDAI